MSDKVALTITKSMRPPEIDSIDVPQAPNLARVRCIVSAIADGATTIEQIAEETDISARHVGYSLRVTHAPLFIGTFWFRRVGIFSGECIECQQDHWQKR